MELLIRYFLSNKMSSFYLAVMDHFLLYCALGVCTLQVLYNEKGSKDKGVISDLKNAKLL